MIYFGSFFLHIIYYTFFSSAVNEFNEKLRGMKHAVGKRGQLCVRYTIYVLTLGQKNRII